MRCYRNQTRLALPLLLMFLCGCGLTRRVDGIGRLTETLGALPADTRAVYVAPDGSLAFEVLGRLSAAAKDQPPRVRYVIVDWAAMHRAMAETERRGGATTMPGTLPTLVPGFTVGPPWRVIPARVTAPSATEGDLPPHFRGARRIVWSGQPVPRQHQLSAVTAQPVELNGRDYLLVAGPYRQRQARTPLGSVAYTALIVPAVAVDAVGGAAQFTLFLISAPAW